MELRLAVTLAVLAALVACVVADPPGPYTCTGPSGPTINCANVSSCAASGLCRLCVSGYYLTLGSTGSCTACLTCPATHIQTQACSTSAPTGCTLCSPIPNCDADYPTSCFTTSTNARCYKCADGYSPTNDPTPDPNTGNAITACTPGKCSQITGNHVVSTLCPDQGSAGDSCTLSCAAGYQAATVTGQCFAISGQPTLSYRINSGDSSSMSLTCTPNTCQGFSQPGNSQFTGTDTCANGGNFADTEHTASSCTLSCNAGYDASGSNTATCTNNGGTVSWTWGPDGTQALTCSPKKCTTAFTPDATSVHYSVTSSSCPAGGDYTGTVTKCGVTCSSGYEYTTGVTTSGVTCTFDGTHDPSYTFDTSGFSCSPKKCTTPYSAPAGSNMHIDGTNTCTSTGVWASPSVTATTCQVRCDNGYMSGSDATKGVTCTLSGSDPIYVLDDPSFSCSPLQCDALSLSVDLFTGGHTQYAVCPGPYDFAHTPTTASSCLIECDTSMIDATPSIHYISTDPKPTYTCVADDKTSGPNSVSWHLDTAVAGSDYQCAPGCSKPDAAGANYTGVQFYLRGSGSGNSDCGNGVFEDSAHGVTASTCDVYCHWGYISSDLNANAKITGTCKADGSSSAYDFNGASLTCIPAKCPAYDPNSSVTFKIPISVSPGCLADGASNLDTSTTAATCQLRCMDGYKNTGSHGMTGTCTASMHHHTASYKFPSDFVCAVQSCPIIPVPDTAALVTGGGDMHVVSYQCKDGGSWSSWGTGPDECTISCDRGYYDAPTYDTNHNIVHNTNSDSKIVGVCKAIENGANYSWTGKLNCQPATCAIPTPGLNRHVVEGHCPVGSWVPEDSTVPASTCSYACNDRYARVHYVERGDDSITCEIDNYLTPSQQGYWEVHTASYQGDDQFTCEGCPVPTGCVADDTYCTSPNVVDTFCYKCLPGWFLANGRCFLIGSWCPPMGRTETEVAKYEAYGANDGDSNSVDWDKDQNSAGYYLPHGNYLQNAHAVAGQCGLPPHRYINHFIAVAQMYKALKMDHTPEHHDPMVSDGPTRRLLTSPSPRTSLPFASYVPEQHPQNMPFDHKYWTTRGSLGTQCEMECEDGYYAVQSTPHTCMLLNENQDNFGYYKNYYHENGDIETKHNTKDYKIAGWSGGSITCMPSQCQPPKVGTLAALNLELASCPVGAIGTQCQMGCAAGYYPTPQMELTGFDGLETRSSSTPGGFWGRVTVDGSRVLTLECQLDDVTADDIWRDNNVAYDYGVSPGELTEHEFVTPRDTEFEFRWNSWSDDLLAFPFPAKYRQALAELDQQLPRRFHRRPIHTVSFRPAYREINTDDINSAMSSSSENRFGYYSHEAASSTHDNRPRNEPPLMNRRLLAENENSITLEYQGEGGGGRQGPWDFFSSLHEWPVCTPIVCEDGEANLDLDDMPAGAEFGDGKCDHDLKNGDTCVLRCQAGYTVLSQTTGTCGLNRAGVPQVMGANIVCQAPADVMCVRPDPPQDAEYLNCLDHTAVNGKCSFRCAAGFQMTGINGAAFDAFMTCGKDTLTGAAEWDAANFVCAPVLTCARDAAPANAEYDNCFEHTAIGDKCTYKCATGFYMTPVTTGGTYTPERTCTESTTPGASPFFSAQDFSCVPIECVGLSLADGFDLSDNHAVMNTCPSTGGTPDPLKFGATCLLACAPGYSATSLTAGVCGVDGNGDFMIIGASILCEQNTCPRPALPANAVYVKCSDQTAVGGSCSFACASGYRVTAAPSIASVTCNAPVGNAADVSFSALSGFTCEPIPAAAAPTCALPDTSSSAVANGVLTCASSVTGALGDQCRTSCNDGYMMVGSGLRTCSLDNGGATASFQGDYTYCSASSCAAYVPTADEAAKGVLAGTCLAGNLGAQCKLTCDTKFTGADSAVSGTCMAITGTSRAQWVGQSVTCVADIDQTGAILAGQQAASDAASKSSSTSTATIGIVVALILGVVIMLGAIIYYVRHHAKKASTNSRHGGSPAQAAKQDDLSFSDHDVEMQKQAPVSASSLSFSASASKSKSGSSVSASKSKSGSGSG